MADNFNLTGFLKKNQLLNENIGGYVDIKPVKEEMGTAMGEATFDSAQQLDLERALSAVKSSGIDLESVCSFVKGNWDRL